MKKIFALILIAAMTLSLAACQGKNTDKETADRPQEVSEESAEAAGGGSSEDSKSAQDADTEDKKSEDSASAPQYSEEELIPEDLIYEDHLILRADSCDLNYGEPTDLKLRIRMPEDWELSDVMLYLEGEPSETMTPDRFEADQELFVEGTLYKDYTVTVQLEDTGEADPSFSKKIFVGMDGHTSNGVTLYRNIEVPDSVVETACEVLDELDELAQRSVSEVETEDGTVLQIVYPDELYKAVLDHLNNSPAVKEVDPQSGHISFVTNDGFAGFFEIVDDSLDLAGSGEVPTTDISELEEIFTPDPGFREAVIDPDVMVMAPVSSADVGMSGDAQISAGEDLAEYLSGSCTVLKDDQCLDWSVFSEWADYGTVLLATHGGKFDRADGGSKVVNWRWWQRTNEEENALQAYTQLKEELESVGTAIDEQKGKHGDSRNLRAMFLSDQNGYQAEYGVLYHIQSDEELYGFDALKENGSTYFHKTEYAVTIFTDAIMHMCAGTTFPNTVFYFGTCNGLGDDRFNQFLLDNGASYVIGYENSIGIHTENDLCRLYFEYFMKEDPEAQTGISDCNLSVYKAVHNANNENAFNLIDDFQKDFGDINWLFFDGEEASRFASLRRYSGAAGFWYDGHGLFEGTVTDKEGNPLEGVTVRDYHYYRKNPGGPNLILAKETKTDAEGKYKFELMDWGMHLIQAYNDSTEAFLSAAFAGEKSEGNDLVLDLVLEVEVLNKDGEFIEDAEVKITYQDEAGAEPEYAALTHNKQGEPVFRYYPGKKGNYRLDISADGYKPEDDTVFIEKNTFCSYTLEELSQIELIAANYSLWNLEGNYFDFMGRNYAVTDLDHNGRLEIISVASGGTGLFEYFTVYEVNQKIDGLIKRFDNFADESLPHPDIVRESGKTVIRDDTYLYAFQDTLRNGFAELYVSLYVLKLKDGELAIDLIGYYSEITNTSTYETKTTYHRADGTEITQSEYDQLLNDPQFGDIGGTTEFKWLNHSDLSSDLVSDLQSSWDGFGYKND